MQLKQGHGPCLLPVTSWTLDIIAGANIGERRTRNYNKIMHCAASCGHRDFVHPCLEWCMDNTNSAMASVAEAVVDIVSPYQAQAA